MVEHEKYLFYKANEFYTIKVYSRVDGYTRCFFKIATDEIHDWYEASTTKIFQRLTYIFQLNKKEFSQEQTNSIINDLQEIAEKLKISEDYARAKILPMRDIYS